MRVLSGWKRTRRRVREYFRRYFAFNLSLRVAGDEDVRATQQLLSTAGSAQRESGGEEGGGRAGAGSDEEERCEARWRTFFRRSSEATESSRRMSGASEGTSSGLAKLATTGATHSSS